MPGPIVVVDDDPVLLRLFVEILAEEGYDARPWRHSAGAFECIRDGQPMLVILDLRLERTDGGWALLQRLRRSAQTAALPIIVCSADADFLQAHAQALENLKTAVLNKPFTVEALLAEVRRLTETRSGA